MTGRALRVGLVCPYSFDHPGGVQNHVLGLAEHLRIQVGVIRMALVLLTTFGMGTGVILYLAVWALTPQRLGPGGTTRTAPQVPGAAGSTG